MKFNYNFKRLQTVLMDSGLVCSIPKDLSNFQCENQKFLKLYSFKLINCSIKALKKCISSALFSDGIANIWNLLYLYYIYWSYYWQGWMIKLWHHWCILYQVSTCYSLTLRLDLNKKKIFYSVSCHSRLSFFPLTDLYRPCQWRKFKFKSWEHLVLLPG